MRWIATILFILVGFLSSSALACEAILKSSPAQFRFRNPVFSKRARVALEGVFVTPSQFEVQAEQSLIFPKSWGKTGLQFVVVLNPETFPIALNVKGESKADGFHVESIKPAANDEQREYFEHVADVNRIKDSVVSIQKPILGCTDLILEGWVVAKLWLKHRLHPDEVVSYINSSVPIEAPRTHSNAYLQLFDLKDSKRPNWLRMAVEQRVRCPNRLKTLYIDAQH